jgi:hypothetical protein
MTKEVAPRLDRDSLETLKSSYLELISNGFVEQVAIQTLNFPRHLYLKLLLEDIDFANAVNEARKVRADFWVAKIAEDVDKDYDKDEIPSKRLRFDKLQFLARADNPERYGNNSKKIDVNIDLKQFRLLPPEEALKSLSQDPFAPEVIEAEIVEEVVKEEEDLL